MTKKLQERRKIELSQLPDDILLLILDKIDTSEAVKTSILSKRWNNLRYLVQIYAPLLTSFRYESDVAWECTKVKLLMLEQVYLDIYGSRYNYRYDENHSTNFFSMLHQLRNATSVSLSLNTIEVHFSISSY